MADALDSALAKVGRAEEHFGRLQKDVRRWREKRSDEMARDNNPERTEFRFYTQWNEPADPVGWALLMGDGVHNLRSALDHAVYECSGPKPPERCEFPIFRAKDRYLLPDTNERGGLYKIRGIKNDVVRALIQGAQPWQRREGPEHHMLWMLHELDIQDKHRLITPVALVPKAMRADLTVEFFGRGVTGQIHVSGKGRIPLEDHALVMTVTTPEPAKRVEMNAALTLAVGFRVAGIDVGITGLLSELCQYVRGLVEQIRDAVVEAEAPPSA